MSRGIFIAKPVFLDGLACVEADLKHRLWRHVRDLHRVAVEDGVVLRGCVNSYYEKQFAQQVFGQATDLRLMPNKIEVGSEPRAAPLSKGA